MKRKIADKLLRWKNSPDRMPLLIMGARQVGKSYSIKEFGQAHFKSLLTINFELDEAYHSFFQGSLRPQEIIRNIESYFCRSISAGDTLIFFDEIQLC